jgi:hypothetical protein
MFTYRPPAYASFGMKGIFRRELPSVESLLDWSNIDYMAREMGKSWRNGAPSTPLAPKAAASNLYLAPAGTSPFFLRNLEGSVLVDLGSGDPSGMLEFARAYRTAAYVGVDSSYPATWSEAGGRTFFIRDDMLRFLFHLEDASVNLSMNAIDECVIRKGLIGDCYSAKLVSEIARVTRSVAFGLSSPFLHGLAGFGFREVGETDGFRVSEYGAVYTRG